MDFDFIDQLDFGSEAWTDSLDAFSQQALDSLDQYSVDTSLSDFAPYDLNSEIGLKGESTGLLGTASNADIEKLWEGSSSTGLLSSASSLLEKNPKLAEFLLKSAGGAWAASKAGDAAKMSEEMALRKRQRINDSIMGMSEIPSGNQSPLTRLNGQRVYKDKEQI